MIILLFMVFFVLLMMPVGLFIDEQITQRLVKAESKKSRFIINTIFVLPFACWLFAYLNQWAQL